MRIDSLIILTALTLTACGSAPDTQASAPSSKVMAPGACDERAGVFFQIDHKGSERAPDALVSSLVVRSSGAWTFGTRRGCMDSGALTKLRTALDGAPWKTTKPDNVCEILIITRTEYRVGGRHVWTELGCASDLLDDKSKAALDTALALVGPLMKDAT